MEPIENVVGLEGEQLDAYTRIIDYLRGDRDSNVLIFTAPGGTGKTFVLRKVVTSPELACKRLAVVAFTGRAASQLSDDGISAMTCHALLYTPKLNEHGELVGWVKRDDKEIMEICGDGLIVDEASMIPYSMHEIFIGLNVPIIYAGDIAQLPPVDPDGGDFNAMSTLESDGGILTLTKNYRFDENNGIGFMANHLRENDTIPRVKKTALFYTRKSAVYTEQFHADHQYDIVICGMNKTRKRINSVIRRARGYSNVMPEIGETVVCLRNSLSSDGSSISNGELFVVDGVIPGRDLSVWMLTGERGGRFVVKVPNETWETELMPDRYKKSAGISIFTYGYCVSCHKSQGSTFDDVLFVDEDVSFFLDRQKFRYTAVSRAAKNLTLAI